MRRRRAILAVGIGGLVLGVVVLVAGLSSGVWRSSGEPIGLMEQRDAGPTVGLPSAALAESCRDSPRAGCDALLTATCWDGPSGVTQYVCVTTPGGSGWERLPRPYELPGKVISASGTGSRIGVGEFLSERDGEEPLRELDHQHSWLGIGDRLRQVEDDGTMIITELDGTVVESIPPPVSDDPDGAFTWRSWALSHDGNTFAVLSGIETSKLWLLDRNTSEWTLLHDDPDYLFLPFVTGVGFSADSRHVITVRADQDNYDTPQTVRRFWAVSISVEDGSVETLREVVTEGGIRSSVSPNGKFMALSNTLAQTRVLDLETLDVSDRIHLCCGDEDKVSWSPDSSFFTTSRGNLVEVLPLAPPVVNGPFDLSVPDPHDVSLPMVRFQATPNG